MDKGRKEMENGRRIKEKEIKGEEDKGKERKGIRGETKVRGKE